MPKSVSARIRKFAMEISYSGVDRKIAKEYEDYLISLASLTVKIDKYYKKDKEGNYPKLKNKEIRELQEEYSKVIASGNSFLKVASEDSHRKAINHVVGKINQFLNGELVEMSNILTTEEIEMKDIAEKANSIHVDISGQQVSYEGGQQSARMPITFTDASGKKVSGYFSEYSVFDSEKEFNDFIDECSGGNKLYKEAFLIMANDKKFQKLYEEGKHSVRYKNKLQQLVNKKKLEGLFDSELSHISNAKKDFSSLKNDADFSVRMFKFLKGCSGLKTKKGILSCDAGVSEGSVLESRNAAMSAMADILGVPDILARSVKMEVKNGDKTIKGVFMEQAAGIDMKKLTDDSLLVKLEEPLQTKMTAKARRQLCDLQVLDFICGNVDRHLGNMTYITKERSDGTVYLDGVQGIDNDCAFGVMDLNRHYWGKNRMKGLVDLNYMSDGMARHIKMLTPEILKTTLRPFNLKPEQIDACYDRVVMLQNELERKTKYCKNLNVIDDSGFDSLSHCKIKGKNYLTKVMSDLSKSAKSELKSAKINQKVNEILKGVDSRLVAESNKVEARFSNVEYQKALDSEATKEDDFKYLKNQLEVVKKGKFIGSRKFARMEDAFKAIEKLDKIAISKKDSDELKNLGEKYTKLLTRIDKYLTMKEEEEKDLLLKGDAPSKYAIARTAYANELREFTEKRINIIKHNLKGSSTIINNTKNQLKESVVSNQNMLQEVNSGPDFEGKEELQNYLRATIFTNKTLIKTMEEYPNKLSINKLMEMASATNQEKMIEKSNEIMTGEKNVEAEKIDEVKEQIAETILSNDNVPTA